MTAESARDLFDEVEPLLPQQARSLRIPWWSFFDQSTLVQHLTRFPGISYRTRDGKQYALGGYWRGRSDVGLVLETAGSKNRADMIARMIERFRELGCAAVILGADEANRNKRWYLEQGWKLVDEIVVYTRRDSHLDGQPEPTQPIQAFGPDQVDKLLKLEKTAFPFLWWSSRDDFLHYAGLPDVSVDVLEVGGEMAGYASVTVRQRQGYLDRLAVHQAYQGRGFGSHLLTFVIGKFHQLGVRTVSLNTQVTNYRAQRLYQKFGFIRTNNYERIYGLWLEDRDDL